jgi:hypothetical protein
MDAFRDRTPHKPLTQPDEIRVVTLLPGTFTDPIVCTLEHICLGDAETTTPYDAVSYTWGDPTETRLITLDSMPYPVTLNLFSALTYLRDSADSTRLWIDSLCINQQDLTERSAQVGRMRDIFASAAHVTIWLGDYGDHPKSDWHLAFQYMVATADWVMRPPQTPAEHHRMSTLESRHARGSDVMAELLARPWFTRMWVVQEVAVRHFRNDDEKVKLMVGHLTAPWFVMYHAFGHLLYIREKADDGVLSERHNRRNGLSSIAKAWRYKHLLTRLAAEEKYVGFAEQLAMYLSRFTLFGATDQRDRVYSLLGMLVGNETLPKYLAPDYYKPTSKVFHEYTTWMLKEGTCLDLLGLSSGPQPDVPSWVPDFVGKRGVFYRNLDNTNPVTILENGKLLEVEALPITTVIATGRRCKIHEARKEISPGSTSQAGQLLVELCRRYLLDCEALIGNAMPKHATGPPAHDGKPHADVETPRQQLSKYLNNSFATSLMDMHWTTPLPFKVLHDILMTDPEHELGPHPRADLAQTYARYIADEFDEYPFFVCENGEVDFCRSTSIAPQLGDMLCLLRGSTHRYLLRPVCDTEQWTLVGTAYMDAEFSHAWHRHGQTREEEMRQTWAAMWKDNKENGNVIRVVIR